MRALYAIGIRLMYALFWCAQFFSSKAKKWIQGRKAPFEKIDPNKDVYWFHCASLGEFDQGLPLMHEVRAKYPEVFILVTFFSPSGMDFFHKRNHPVDRVCYLPLDTKRNATNFVSHFQPKKVFFIKYEFWYNHLKAARRNGAEIYGVSSLFRPNHRFFKRFGGFFRKALHLFNHFYCQDEQSKRLLASIGIENASVTGDTRYDRMYALTQTKPTNEIIDKFKGEEKLLLLGSTWNNDENALKTVLTELLYSWKIVIAPHDVSEEHIQQIEQLFYGNTFRYTERFEQEKRILILNTIGNLTSAYRYADIAYVGGGFTGKLHNILEPGAFGVPVIFGPKYDRFPEALHFLQREVALSVMNGNEFLTALRKLSDQNERVKNELAKLFEENRGAAKKIIAALDGIY